MGSSRRTDVRLLALLLAAGSITCGGENPTEPVPEPAALAMVRGDAQSAAVGTPLGDSLVVLVTDVLGAPVRGVAVAWTASGGGQVSAPSTRTGPDGRTAVGRTLGPQAGEQLTVARANGLEGSPVTFRSSARPGAAASLLRVSGDGQAGLVRGVLADSLVVQVLDANGNPVPGTTVEWTVQSGGGATTPPSGATAGSGLAVTRWTLGPVEGEQSLVATTGTLAPVSFTATGTPGAPAKIVGDGGDGQTGAVATELPVALSVQVLDAADNPVANATVQWSTDGTGGSTVASASATDADGVARTVRTLGTTVGTYTTSASVAGLAGSPVTFTSTAMAGPAARLGISTQPSASATNGVALARQPRVQVEDAYGVGAAGVSIAASAVGSGLTLNGATTVTAGADGRASFTGLALVGPAGTARLRFTTSGIDPATSADISLAPGAAATLTVTTQPPGDALTKEVWVPSAQPEVAVADIGGNPLAGVSVTASVASGGGTLQGTATATSAADGTAAFGDLGIAGTGTHRLAFSAGQATATSSTISLAALPLEATRGKWDAPVDWSIVPLHISLLPTGKLLAWGKFEAGTLMMGEPRLWDPSAGAPITAAMVHADTMLFCAGHALMPDGRLMVSGGHKEDGLGLDVTNIFDPLTEQWVPGLPKMARGRWYPTVTELADGRVVTVAGKDTAGKVVPLPEIWENGKWVQLPGANLSLPYYPRQFLAPDGRLFYAGERIRSRWLDVDVVTGSGRGRWSPGPDHIWPFNRDYGSAVMYEAGKIVYAGGGGDPDWDNTPDARAIAPTATAETIDLTGGSPAWRSTDDMHYPRRHHNATLLPNGQVLVTGGTSAGGFNELSGSVHAAEAWDPRTGDWTELAANGIDRGYHSVSILLPDGTVLHGASGDANAPDTGVPYPSEANHEIFRPPYLFKGARPTITSLSSSTIGYGATFTVTSASAAQITEVRWIRLGSVTHSFDMNQRGNTLSFTRGTGAISVAAPASPTLAPPGHYILFILNRNGVPSVGRILKVQ